MTSTNITATVTSRKQFAEFVKWLSRDANANADQWQHRSLAD